MKYLSVILIFSLFSACNVENKKNTLPSSPMRFVLEKGPVDKLIFSEFILDNIYEYAAWIIAGNKLDSSRKNEFSRWVSGQIIEKMGTDIDKAFKVWMIFRKINAAQEMPDYLSTTLKFAEFSLKTANIKQTLHALTVLVGSKDKSQDWESKISGIINWLVDIDSLRMANCMKVRSKESRCIANFSGDSILRSIIKPDVGDISLAIYKKYLERVHNIKFTGKSYASILNSDLNKELKSYIADRITGMILFEKDYTSAISNLVKEVKLDELNPWLDDILKRIAKSPAKNNLWEDLSNYTSAKLGHDFSSRICEIIGKNGNKSAHRNCLVKLNMNKQEELLRIRDFLVKNINENNLELGAMKDLYKLSYRRFAELVEREYLDEALIEAEYIKKITSAANSLWKNEKFFSLSTLHSRLSSIYMIQGNKKQAREELELSWKENKHPYTLAQMIQMEFWDKNYKKATEMMMKFSDFEGKNKGYASYLFMQLARIHSVMQEFLGDAERANQVRMVAVEFFRKIVGNISGNSLRAGMLVEAGELYNDLGKQDFAVQLFQHALSIDSSCFLYRSVIKSLVLYKKTALAVDVFNAMAGKTDCDDKSKLYSAITVLPSAMRDGLKPYEYSAVTNFLKSYKENRWQRYLKQIVTGEISCEDALKKAANNGQRAEATFYCGMYMWAKKGWKAAEEKFKKTMEFKIYNYIEHDMSFWFMHYEKLASEKKDSTGSKGRLF
ncbi:hypothetical protein KKF34_18070 [Myxococcota bacterium]|nr:hypothetical protein [Myxococcota bacterium]MBU1379669.1 hypothetical protein [Myxococcota bacterium]MBU1498792.1 hypothetical protein [Myxococcota bacterium]